MSTGKRVLVSATTVDLRETDPNCRLLPVETTEFSWAVFGKTTGATYSDHLAGPLLHYGVVTGTIADMGDRLPSVSIACTP